MPQTTYSNLVNVSGTIYNEQTGKGYATPAELAKDLGIAPHQIDWAKIAAGSLPASARPSTPIKNFYMDVTSGTGQRGWVGPFSSEQEARIAFNQYKDWHIQGSLENISQFATPPQSVISGTQFVGGTSLPSGGAATRGGTEIGAPVVPEKPQYEDLPEFSKLSPDAKELIKSLFEGFTQGRERDISAALPGITEQAKVKVEPFAKAKLALMLGEVESKIAFTQGDLQRASDITARTRKEIADDLTSGLGDISFEQQAEMARVTRAYDEDLLTIADQAAEKGLTFATGARSRVLAEERRREQFQDVIQSSRRKAALLERELKLKAARGDIQAQEQLAEIKAKGEFQLRAIGRSAEEVLGTANLPGTPGYAPVGGVIGTIEQQRRQQEQAATVAGITIAKESKPF